MPRVRHWPLFTHSDVNTAISPARLGERALAPTADVNRPYGGGRATMLVSDNKQTHEKAASVEGWFTIPIDRLRASFPRATAWVEPHFDVLRKAISFALIGVINVVVDATVFFLSYAYLRSHAAALRSLDALAQSCACTSRDTLVLIASNVTAWGVAVSGSYAMNSFITFAAESGRRLRWWDYGAFVASGILGAVANTSALVIAAHFMPVLPAKGCAILTAFAVNFSMSHFVVFSPRRKKAARTG
jgi:putative flippase GtrA